MTNDETRDDELAGDLDLDEGDTGDVVGGASVPNPTIDASLHGSGSTSSGSGSSAPDKPSGS